jgi:putative transposase
MQSPVLVRRGAQWWLHTSIEKTFTSPPKIAEHLTIAETRICAVDLNLDQHVAVCTVQTVAGTIVATRFIGEGRAISGFRKSAPFRRMKDSSTGAGGRESIPLRATDPPGKET